jgi:mRNA interferase RelE/StbE
MVDKRKKFLNSLTEKDKKRLAEAVSQIERGDTQDLDIKKLKGVENQYRVRVGKFRIIYEMVGDRFIILDVARRDDTTYNF